MYAAIRQAKAKTGTAEELARRMIRPGAKCSTRACWATWDPTICSQRTDILATASIPAHPCSRA